MADKSKYRIAETPNGFTVTGEDRNPVIIELDEYGIVANGALFSFYSYYKLSKHIARELMRDWQPPEDKLAQARKNLAEKHNADLDQLIRINYQPPWLESWAKKQTAKAIGKRIHKQWQRLLTMVPPDVLAVQKALFAATRRVSDIAGMQALYQHPQIVSDVSKYRAAAIALSLVDELYDFQRKNALYRSPEMQALHARARELNLEIAPRIDIDRNASIDDHLRAMYNWKALFSCIGKSYRSLNRTLMNLPGGIAPNMLKYLTTWRLGRPFTKRLELVFLLEAAMYIDDHRWDDTQRFESFSHMTDKATEEEIKRAMVRVSQHLRSDLSHRRVRDVRRFTQFLFDYPESHNGNVIGLADKSIDYHRNRLEEGRQERLKELGADTPASIPPIALPEKPEITFLASVEEIINEGREMGHCIADYARDAVRGNCYLFHVEKDRDAATVQVSFQGRVVQAHGPSNKSNNAVVWAKRVLNRWGSGFPDECGPAFADRRFEGLPIGRDVDPFPEEWDLPF
jgi:hypothetical protein